MKRTITDMGNYSKLILNSAQNEDNHWRIFDEILVVFFSYGICDKNFDFLNCGTNAAADVL